MGMRAVLLLFLACLFCGCETVQDPTVGRPHWVAVAKSYLGLTYSEVVKEKGVVYKRSHESNPPHGRVELDDVRMVRPVLLEG